MESARNKLINQEIPDLQKQLKEANDSLPSLTKDAEDAQEQFEGIKKTQRDLQALKQQAAVLARTWKEIASAQTEVGRLEQDLMATGGARTADDVQGELDRISTEMYVLLGFLLHVALPMN